MIISKDFVLGISSHLFNPMDRIRWAATCSYVRRAMMERDPVFRVIRPLGAKKDMQGLMMEACKYPHTGFMRVVMRAGGVLNDMIAREAAIQGHRVIMSCSKRRIINAQEASIILGRMGHLKLFNRLLSENSCNGNITVCLRRQGQVFPRTVHKSDIMRRICASLDKYPVNREGRLRLVREHCTVPDCKALAECFDADILKLLIARGYQPDFQILVSRNITKEQIFEYPSVVSVEPDELTRRLPYQKHLEVVVRFIQQGAVPNQRTLNYAMLWERYDIVRFLIKNYRLDVNAAFGFVRNQQGVDI